MTVNAPAVTVKSILDSPNMKRKFEDILKKRASGFTANLAVMVSNSEALKRCDPYTVIAAAVISASLDLSIDPNLGFAAIVPFGSKATFQIMYKGLVQLAMRSGQYKTINVSEIYDGMLVEENPITGEYVFDIKQKKSEKVIGYAAYFRLLNGFEKTEYWDIKKIEKHGKRFSQTFKKGSGMWVDDFDAMAKKTVLKNLISKWGILSIEMQTAVHYDQGVVRDVETGEVEFIDNEPHTVEEVPMAVVADPLRTPMAPIDPKPAQVRATQLPNDPKLM